MQLFQRQTSKIFCISMQRTGTTSVGKFFKLNKFKVADWVVSRKNNWSNNWYLGDFEKIFNSKDFKNNQVFEDDPWWLPEFYKVLFHRFPKSKFILFIRNSDEWFQSMLNHSKGKTLGNTKGHCKAYRREIDFYTFIDKNQIVNYDITKFDNLLELKGYEEHYKTIYELRNREIIEFFNKISPDSLFVCQLDDPLKWEKLAKFVGIYIPKEFEVHENKSKN